VLGISLGDLLGRVLGESLGDSEGFGDSEGDELGLVLGLSLGDSLEGEVGGASIGPDLVDFFEALFLEDFLPFLPLDLPFFEGLDEDTDGRSVGGDDTDGAGETLGTSLGASEQIS